MHARTITANIVPGRLDEALQIFRDEIHPMIEQQPGHISTNLFIDRDRNRAQTVTIWESRAAEQATSERSEYLSKVLGRLNGFLANRHVASWEVAGGSN
ncbi:MAG: hypothetical protein CMH41_02655 [Micrococcales bacterium]|nr:hypothetical protein [Micrococcales bacterium]